jgi:hypothetical protein
MVTLHTREINAKKIARAMQKSSERCIIIRPRLFDAGPRMRRRTPCSRFDWRNEYINDEDLKYGFPTECVEM